jgi:caffeoyl-CoA O-methyltransferase
LVVFQGVPGISIQPEEGRFLQFLVKPIGAKLIIEIGAFGGYSGVWLARGLGPGGKLITIEMDSQNAAVAREHFQMAGLQKIVDVRVGVALNILEKMSNKGPSDS